MAGEKEEGLVRRRGRGGGTALFSFILFQNPFYVRCIKPNEIKSPVSLNEERVRHQVIKIN